MVCFSWFAGFRVFREWPSGFRLCFRAHTCRFSSFCKLSGLRPLDAHTMQAKTQPQPIESVGVLEFISPKQHNARP